jgi:hypothetical protein
MTTSQEIDRVIGDIMGLMSRHDVPHAMGITALSGALALAIAAVGDETARQGILGSVIKTLPEAVTAAVDVVRGAA